MHFNIVYFGFVFLVALIFDYFNDKHLFNNFKVSRYDYVLLFSSILFVVAYCVFIYFNLADFQNDMAFQFARKLNRQPFYESFKNVSIIFIVMSFGVYFFIKKERNSLIFTASALSLFILFSNGQ